MVLRRSMLVRLLLAIGLAFAAAPVLAASPAASPVSRAAEPLQFYVFSFTDTPADEAAQDVVVGALAYDLEIDPAVDAVVTFRADGWYSSDALLKDFGTALLDQDIALVRTGAGSYALVPRTNAPMLMARGGVVMQLAQPQSARTPVGLLADEEPRTVYGAAPARWWDGAAAALALFFAGALAGAAALFGGQVVWRRAEGRRLSPPLLRLTDQRQTLQPPVEAARPDPELVIPRFDDRT